MSTITWKNKYTARRAQKDFKCIVVLPFCLQKWWTFSVYMYVVWSTVDRWRFLILLLHTNHVLQEFDADLFSDFLKFVTKNSLVTASFPLSCLDYYRLILIRTFAGAGWWRNAKFYLIFFYFCMHVNFSLFFGFLIFFIVFTQFF